MTDVMPERQAVDLDELADGEPAGAGVLDAVDEQLIAWLAGRARERGLQLAGEGGLLAQLTKRLVESALEGEITDHLGYYKYDAAGRDGNSRNGHRSKTVLTEVGPVAIDVPHDRDGSFEPKIVGKRNRCLSGIDELVISLSAKGLTIGDVQAHLGQVYGADVSRALYPVGGGRRPSLIADATPAWPPPPGSTAERPASGPSRAGNPANPVRVHTPIGRARDRVRSDRRRRSAPARR
jgi:putative transposase